MTNKEKLHQLTAEEMTKIILEITNTIDLYVNREENEEDAADKVFSILYELEEWLTAEYADDLEAGYLGFITDPFKEEEDDEDEDEYLDDLEEEYDEDEYLDDLEEENIE